MLIHITNLLMGGDIEDAIIIAPLSTLGSWQRDIQKLTSTRRNLAKKITIVNYDKAWRRDEYYKEWGAIVLDEAHSIARRTSKRSKFAHEIAKVSKYRYILTGTPTANSRLEDYFSLMSFLQPNIFGTYREFSARYLIERQLAGTFVKFVVGYRHKEELLGIVDKLSYRITKKECLDLPEKLEDEVIYCELKEKAKYKELTQNVLIDYEMNIGNPLTKVAKMRQLVSGFVYDDDKTLHELKTDKLARLEEIIESIYPEKLVVFCEFTYSIKSISKLLDKMKIKHVVLNGEQKDKNIWRQFQSDDDIKVIVCQYLTANSGIDLFASSHMVFYEPNLSTTVCEQSRDRIHRIGQNQPCSYYWLITQGTIEEDIYKRLVKYQDFNKEYLDSLILNKSI